MGLSKRLLFTFLLASGCSSPASTTARPTEVAAAGPSPALNARAPGLPRIQAIMLAEQFVREQGYTDTAPTRELVRESLDAEDPEEILATRSNTLLPRHVGAHYAEGTWIVLFAYRASTNPESGRAVQIDGEQSARMVHQGIRLPDAAEPLTLVGRVANMPANNADCGTFHFVATVEYEVLSVTSGEFDGSRVMVLQGCPELPRSQYQEGAGDAGPLALGDVHALQLVPYAPLTEGDHAFLGSTEHPELHRYWAQRTLRHAPAE